MSDSKSLLKAVSSSYAYLIANLLLSLWLLPYVLIFLTKAEYAVFAITADIVAWLALTSLGVGPSLNVRAGQLIGQKKYDNLNTVVNSAFWGQLVLSGSILIVAIYAFLFPTQIIGSTINDNNLGLVLFLLLIGGAIGFIGQPLNGILVANKQIHIDNYLKFGTLILRTGLTIIFLNLGYKLLSIALSNIIALVVSFGITYWRVKSTIPELTLKINYFSKAQFKDLLKTGIWITVGGIAGILISKTDNFIISKYFSLELVTSFFITYKLYTIAEMLHQQLFNLTRPYFVQIYGSGDTNKFSLLYKLLYQSSFLTSCLMGFSIFLINKWFISYWLGPDYFLGDTLNFWLCINFIVQSAVLPNRIILVSTLFKVKENGISRLIEGVIKLFLCIIFIPIIGINAVVISGVISSLLFSTFYFNYLAGQLIKQKNTNNILSIFLLSISLLVLLTDEYTIKIAVIVATLLVVIFNAKSQINDLTYFKRLLESVKPNIFKSK